MTHRGWLLAYAGYLAVQLCVRILVGPALELDEAEALFFSRDLSWGYNAQPPLYFWLQWGMFQILGPGIPALALLKALLLWVFAASLHRLLRASVVASEAGWAVLSLALLPQILWESQRALTHSVLVLTMTAVAALALWQALQRGRARDWAGFGVALGLGMLSKYNFALLPVGLIIAAAVMPDLRHRLSAKGLLLAVGIAGLLALPSAIWVAGHADIAGGSVHKLGLDVAPNPVVARVMGLGAFLAAAATFLALAALMLAPLWRGRGPMPVVARWLAIGAGAGAAVLLAGVLVAGMTAVKDRWLLPLLWPLVPAAALCLPIPPWQRGLRVGAFVLAAAALPYASLRDPGYRGADFGPLSSQAGTRAVASNSTWVLGNLALIDPARPLAWLPHQTVPAGALIVALDAAPDGLGAQPEGEILIVRGSRVERLLLGVAPQAE